MLFIIQKKLLKINVIIKMHLLKFENPLLLVPTVHLIIIIIQFLFLTNIIEYLLSLNNLYKEIFNVTLTLNTNLIEFYYNYCNINLINYKEPSNYHIEKNELISRKDFLYSPDEKELKKLPWYDILNKNPKPPRVPYWYEKPPKGPYTGKFKDFGPYTTEETIIIENDEKYTKSYTEEFNKNWDFKPVSDRKEFWLGLAAIFVVGFFIGNWLSTPTPPPFPEWDVRNLKRSDLVEYVMKSRYSVHDFNPDDGTFPIKYMAPEPALHVRAHVLPTWLGENSIYIGPNLNENVCWTSSTKFTEHSIWEHEASLFDYIVWDRIQGPAKSNCFDKHTGELKTYILCENTWWYLRPEAHTQISNLLRNPNNWIKS